MTNSELQELAAARLNNSWMAGPSLAKPGHDDEGKRPLAYYGIAVLVGQDPGQHLTRETAARAP